LRSLLRLGGPKAAQPRTVHRNTCREARLTEKASHPRPEVTGSGWHFPWFWFVTVTVAARDAGGAGRWFAPPRPLEPSLLGLGLGRAGPLQDGPRKRHDHQEPGYGGGNHWRPPLLAGL